MTQPETEFLPTRSTLLSRLKDLGDDAGWRQFFDTYWKLIFSVAKKSGLGEAEAQDVVQETIIAVARNIGTFKYDPHVCSFKTWLMQVTRSRILNHLRYEQRHQTGRVHGSDAATGTGTVERLADTQTDALEQIWEDEWGKNLMDAAINRVKRRVPVEQFQLFDFYVLRDRPVGEVAALFSVSAARVYLAKHRISRQIKAEMRNLESTPI